MNVIKSCFKNPLAVVYEKYIDDNILLFSGGGFGKSTAMESLNHKLLAEAANGSNVVPIYIDVKKLHTEVGEPLLEYIHLMYIGDDTDRNAVRDILNGGKATLSRKYKLVILIDGFNEAQSQVKGRMSQEIKNYIKGNENTKNERKIKIQFVVSSRIKETDDDFVGFKTLQLNGLDDNQIKEYIEHKFDTIDEDKTINPKLVEILRAPLFMKAFVKAYDKKSPLSDLYEERTVRQSQILDGYVEKLLKDAIDKPTEQRKTIDFLLNFWLPKLAFEMAKESGFLINDSVVSKELCSDYFEKLFKGRTRKEQIRVMMNSIQFSPVTISCVDFALLKENEDEYSFVHQIWRDFFAAKHIINLMNAQSLDELKIYVDENIRQYTGELVREYDDDYKYSKKPEFKVVDKDGERKITSDKDTRRCECDFEEKDNLKAWSESPIEYFMQENYSVLNEKPIVIRNLIEIMKICRNKRITACYDNLDLKKTTFLSCNLSRSSFNNSNIYKDDFLSQGHARSVVSVSFSHDGKKIVSGGLDETVRIWDAESGKQLVLMTGHSGAVSSVKFSPDDKLIASGSWDGTISIWNIKNGKQISQLSGPKCFINSVSFSADGKKIVSGDWNNLISIWDVKTGKLIRVLTGHEMFVYSATFSPDGKRIASGSADETIRIWDFDTGKQIGNPLIGHTGVVNSVTFSPDGKRLVSGSADETIRIWDVESGKQLKQFMGHRGSITSVEYSPNGKRIVSGSCDKTIRVWNSETGKEILEPLFGHTLNILSVAYSSDGKRIVSGSTDETIRIWDAETGKIIRVLSKYKICVNSVAFSCNSKKIVSGTTNGIINMWSLKEGKLLKKPIKINRESIDAISFSLKKQEKACLSDGKNIYIWDLDSEKQIGEALIGHGIFASSVSFSQNGSEIASGSFDRTIRVWDAETGNQIGDSLKGHTEWIESVAISRDGKKIVSGSRDNTIILWDLEKKRQLWKRLIGHTSCVSSVTFSPDEKKIVSGSWDGTIRIWNVKNGKEIMKLTGHKGYVLSVAISPDGKTIVSGGSDKIICLWDYATGKPICAPLTGHNDSVNSVSFSPDGKNIASSGNDGIVRIWNLENKTQFIMQPISAIIQDCHFENANYNQFDSDDFYRILYTNGANVPKEYEPKPILIDNAENE